MNRVHLSSPPAGGMGLRARETIFDLRRSVATVHSDGFGPPEDDVQVVVFAAAARRFAAAVGAEAAWAMLHLLGAADRDELGRLVVLGGTEALRRDLGWGKDKTQRVVRLLCEAGYAMREQLNEIGTSGKHSFGMTVLVLSPSGPPTGDAGDGVPAAGSCGGEVSGYAAGDGIHEPNSREQPGRSAAVSSGNGTTSSAHDHDDEQAHSSSLPQMNEPRSPTGTAPAARDLKLLEALDQLGFVDGETMIELYGDELVARAVAYVRSRSGITNPGAYLRNMLRNRRVPALVEVPTSDLSVDAAASAHLPGLNRLPGDDEVVHEAGRSLSELEAILAKLPAPECSRITHEVESALAVSVLARRSPLLTAGFRQQHLERLLSDAGYLGSARSQELAAALTDGSQRDASGVEPHLATSGTSLWPVLRASSSTSRATQQGGSALGIW